MLMNAVLFTASLSCASATTTSAHDALHDLFERDWEFQMKAEPTWASSLGDRRYNDRWPDLSPAGIDAAHRHDQDMVAALRAIDRKNLDPADQLNADLFGDLVTTRLGLFEHKLFLLPLDQMGGVHSQEHLVDDLRFETAKDYDDWLARLRAFPVLVDQHLALLRRGLAEQVLPPQVVITRALPQIEAQLVDDPTNSSFFGPFRDAGSKATPQQVNEARTLVATTIVPALKAFHAFVEREYLPACPAAVGVSARKGGKETYAFLVRMHTTTTRTPEEVHALGLKEVARIRGEMTKVAQKIGHTGPLQELFRRLRTDPKFFPKSGDEILTTTRALAKMIDGRLPLVLKTMPRMPYGVEPVPDTIAPNTTTAYYSGPAADGSRAGTYYVNLYRPEMRPTWEMVPLCLHEAAPGHHTQIALAQERSDLPKFRRHALPYTAFVEGWGLYAESLGDEMQLYGDPYDQFGRLTYEMWRAVRLVVDTGLHAKGWTREQAIDYFAANAPKTELDITNEIDRYIVWPGQALAYKSGQLKIRELRERAQKRFGAKFDLGAFHDVVLLEGPLPLSLLERRVQAWIDAQ